MSSASGRHWRWCATATVSRRTRCSRTCGGAPPDAERDLYQGLVHVAVATYQETRGNAVGRRRQLEKAQRRLAAYEPAYEGLDIAALRAWCAASLAAERCPPLPADAT